MPVAEKIKALDLADALRQGRAVARPFDLWLAAHHEADGKLSGRVERFRHAMIHGGYTLTRKGGRYRRCPMCHGKLSR